MSRWLFRVIGGAITLASLATGWVWMEYDMFRQAPLMREGEPRYVMVKPGSSARSIASELERQGLMPRPLYFTWMARWQDKAHRLQSGEYALSAGMRPQELLDAMVSGKVVEYPLTLIEGWTFVQLRQALTAHEFITHTLDGVSDAGIMEKLGRPGMHPEGRFYPDTYRFPRGTADIDVLRRAYQAMESKLDALWGQRAEGLPYRTPYEALIMASIVERETAVAAERFAIAGVFVRRLQKGMRLQTDPTVIYGLGENYDGNLRRRDLRADTPYNTYTRAGLPPTPIAMPGAAAIEAALHPEDGDALYFVSRGDGSHVFSATLEEHNRAVVKYQLKGEQRAFSSMP